MAFGIPPVQGPGQSLCLPRSSPLNADTGEYKWHYQFVPEDSWDFDSVQQLTLADIRINGPDSQSHHAGEQEWILLRSRSPDRQGDFGIAVRSGELGERNRSQDRTADDHGPEAFYGKDQAVQIFPGPGGAHNWAPMAFNPTTNLMYIPTSANSSSTYRLPDTFTYQRGTHEYGRRSSAVVAVVEGRGGPGAPVRLRIRQPRPAESWNLGRSRSRIRGADRSSAGRQRRAGVAERRPRRQGR